MIRGIVYKILMRRHFWRYASFSEVAELYVSNVLRTVATYVAAAFISVYLFQNGFSVRFIALYWALYYLFKLVIDLPMAQYAARFGPKHGILLSNLLYIPSMIAYTLVPEYGVPLLVLTGVVQASSASLYNICYNIDFSKVKTMQRAGKELAIMNIFNKLAAGVSPLIGGFLALYFGPACALWAAAIFFALSALPLLRTGEPKEIDRRIIFRGFPWRLVYRSLIANIGLGSDAAVLRVSWPLFIGVVIVGVTSSNEVYAVLGGLASLVMFSDIVFSYVYGQLIDRRKGGALLQYGIVGTIASYLVRPFLGGVTGVALVNIGNEAVAIGYVMAFTRGTFDLADRTGHRATYIGLTQMMQDFGASLSAFCVFVMVSLLGVTHGLRWFFFVGAALLCLLFFARFPLYRR